MTEAIRRAPSVARMLTDRVAASPEAEAFRWPVPGAGGAATWESMTWAQLGERVTELAAGLLALGLRPEQRVIVFAPTRVEWVLADLAINSAAGATTTVYPSSLAEDVLHIVTDSEAVIAFVEDESKAAVLRELADRTPDLHHVVLLDGSGDGSDRELALDTLAARGRELLAAAPDAVGADPGDESGLVPLVHEHEVGALQRPVEVELRPEHRRAEAGIKFAEALQPGLAVVPEQVVAAPGAGRLEGGDVVSVKLQLPQHAAQEVRVAVVPAGGKRVREGDDLNAAAARRSSAAR